MSVTAIDGFAYDDAFSRNLGWVTREEQARLRRARVAIAGLGGVGGSHLLTLTRLGIGSFHIADLDTFEVANFNRQAGASLESVGRPKAEVLARMALQVNPELELRSFDRGVTPENLPEFFQGVDVYVDGLDFFAMGIRQQVFAYCHENNIPAITAAPLGMGTALLVFLPGRMSFEDYFCVDGHPFQEQLLRFIVGLSPALLQRGYLVAPEAVDFARQRGPSTPMACDLCAGVVGAETLKILLRRGTVRPAPWAAQFDAYQGRYRVTWRPWGNRNPLQRLLMAVARKQLAASERKRGTV